ncbi:hypothetical protein LguiA_029811 [Lonicera macranthoides]
MKRVGKIGKAAELPRYREERKKARERKRKERMSSAKDYILTAFVARQKANLSALIGVHKPPSGPCGACQLCYMSGKFWYINWRNDKHANSIQFMRILMRWPTQHSVSSTIAQRWREAPRLCKITTSLLTTPNSYLHNAILHMYATCGTSCSARKVFDEIPLHHKDTVDWTTLMGYYTSTVMARNPSPYSLICKNTACCLTPSPWFVCSTRVHN